MLENFQLFVIISILIFISPGSNSQRKLICLDTKEDVDAAGWKFNTDIKSVATSAALPKAFGNLNSLQGNGIWYVEGPTTGSAKEVTFRSSSTLYTSRAKSVQIYLKYYDNAPRRNSLFPAKSNSGGSLLLLPVSTQSKWTEVRQEIDPNESPIELTGHLGANQFILFEKIVVTVDSPLPSDLSMSCQSLTSLPTFPPPSQVTTATRKPVSPGGSISSIRPSSPTLPDLSKSDNSNCPAIPTFPECKCNCLCNCGNKC